MGTISLGSAILKIAARNCKGFKLDSDQDENYKFSCALSDVTKITEGLFIEDM